MAKSWIPVEVWLVPEKLGHNVDSATVAGQLAKILNDFNIGPNDILRFPIPAEFPNRPKELEGNGRCRFHIHVWADPAQLKQHTWMLEVNI